MTSTFSSLQLAYRRQLIAEYISPGCSADRQQEILDTLKAKREEKTKELADNFVKEEYPSQTADDNKSTTGNNSTDADNNKNTKQPLKNIMNNKSTDDNKNVRIQKTVRDADGNKKAMDNKNSEGLTSEDTLDDDETFVINNGEMTDYELQRQIQMAKALDIQDEDDMDAEPQEPVKERK